MQRFATARKELLPQVSARRIFDLIKSELSLVEAEFERQASSNIQVINYLGEYLRASGGKRTPALLYELCDRGDGSSEVCKACDGDGDAPHGDARAYDTN